MPPLDRPEICPVWHPSLSKGLIRVSLGRLWRDALQVAPPPSLIAGNPAVGLRSLGMGWSVVQLMGVTGLVEMRTKFDPPKERTRSLESPGNPGAWKAVSTANS